MSVIDHRIKYILHHFRDSGRLNVLMALIAHSNVRNRCYPSMRLIAKETGYALAAVNDAKKWLEEHGAIEIVKYQQRVGDELKIKSVRQNVYQLTGVINLDGAQHPYLYVSPTEISDSETLLSEISPSEMEVVKSVKVVQRDKDSKSKEKKEPIASSTQASKSLPPIANVQVPFEGETQNTPAIATTKEHPPSKVARKVSPRPVSALGRRAQQEVNATVAAIVASAPKEKSILAWVIDDAWAGVEDKRTSPDTVNKRLIPVLMGTSKKFDCADPSATEAEILGFTRWYRYNNPRTPLPMEAKLASWFGSFRRDSDSARFIQTGQRLVNTIYRPTEAAPALVEPEIIPETVDPAADEAWWGDLDQWVHAQATKDH